MDKDCVHENPTTDDDDIAMATEATSQSCWRRNALLMSVAVGVAVGFGLGFGLRSCDLSSDAIMWIGLPGHLFLRILMMTILPLIIGSIVTGTANSDPGSSGRVSGVSLGFFVIVNFLGALLGIITFLVFRPGTDSKDLPDDGHVTTNAHHLQTQDMFADLIRNIVPDNIVSACFQKAQTQYTVSEVVHEGTNITIKVFTRHVGVASGANLLGIILVSAVVGMAASSVKESSVSFIPFFKATSDIFIRIVMWCLWSTPVGVASLICVSIVQVKDIEQTFRSLGMFILTFTIGILIQKLVIIPIVYVVFIRKNPAKFLASAFRPWIATFGAASSIVAMPDMITICENVHGVDPRVSRFTIPFGVAISRPGSAYFIALSCLFISAMTGVETSASEVLLIGILTTLSSLAIPAIPSASIVSIILILESVNVDATGVGILLALEWITDRVRGGSNVLHVVTGTVVVNKLCASRLPGHTPQDMDNTEDLENDDVTITI